VHETPTLADHGAMCLVNNTRPVVLDLCSGAGGAAAGYARVGYRVICVDNDPGMRGPSPSSGLSLTVSIGPKGSAGSVTSRT
ncbi:MAG: hypothetical protein WAK82_45035, partial [Streptosporangiaceae bacterium]